MGSIFYNISAICKIFTSYLNYRSTYTVYEPLNSSSANVYLELLPSVNFRNRLIVVNNRLLSINRIVNYILNMACPWWFVIEVFTNFFGVAPVSINLFNNVC